MDLSEKEMRLILLAMDELSDSIAAGNLEEEDEKEDLFGQVEDLKFRFKKELKI